MQKAAVSGPVLLTHLTPARAGAWGCSSPGAGGGIVSAQAGCSLLEGLRSLWVNAVRAKEASLGMREESVHWCREQLGIDPAVRGMQVHSCAENVLNGLIFPSAGQVQTLFSA